jgi:hypothetical protein
MGSASGNGAGPTLQQAARPLARRRRCAGRDLRVEEKEACEENDPAAGGGQIDGKRHRRGRYWNSIPQEYQRYIAIARQIAAADERAAVNVRDRSLRQGPGWAPNGANSSM